MTQKCLFDLYRPTCILASFILTWVLITHFTGKVNAQELTPQQSSQLADAEKLYGQILLHLKARKYAEAIEVASNVVALTEKAVGPNHKSTAVAVGLLAKCYDLQGNQGAAEPLYQRALKINETNLGLEDPSNVSFLDNLAMLYYKRGNYTATEPLFVRLLKIREKTLGAEHADTGASLNNLAELYRAQGNYVAAERLFQQAIKVWGKALGPEHPNTLSAISNLAALYYDQGKYVAAEPLFQQVLKTREKTLGPEHPSTATSLNNLSELYRTQRNYAAAEPLQQRALMINEKVLGPEHLATALSLNNLGLIYQAQVNYTAAEPLHLRALKIREKTLGPEHPDTAASLHTLAELYRAQGKYSAAEPLYQRSLKIFEKVRGADHPLTVNCLNNLAVLYFTLGNHAAAEPLFDRILKIRERTVGPDHPDTATCLNNLAELNRAQGNYAVAEPLYQRAIRIWEKVLGPEHPNTSYGLNNLAELCRNKGDFAQAESLHMRALEVSEKILGPEHPDTARSLNNLALMYYSQRKYATAEPLFQRSLRIFEKTLGPEHSLVATTVNNLGLLYRDQGNYESAEPLFQRSLEIVEKRLGPDHPNTVSNLNNLGILKEERQRPDAVDLFDRSRIAAFHHVSRVLPSLSESEQRMFLKTNYEIDFHVALSQAMRHLDRPSNVAQSVAWIANGKGIAQDALATRNLQTRDLSDPKLAPVVEQLLQTRRQLAAIAMIAAEPNKQVERQKRIDSLTTEEAKLAKELTSATGTKAEAKEWVSTEELRRSLLSGSVLVDIARFDVFNFEESLKGNPSRRSCYAAWITPPVGKGEPKLVELGLAEEIESLLDAIRKSIQSDAIGAKGAIQTKGEEVAEKELNKTLRKLSERIWEPIALQLGTDTKSVILSPDGALWLAPWSALPVGNDNQLLIEKYSLRLVICGRDVVNSRTNNLLTSTPAIFADPKFDSSSTEKNTAIEAVLKKLPAAGNETLRSFSAKGLIPRAGALPNTAVEAKLIEPNIAKFTNVKPVAYTQQYALESVAKELKRPKVAIFATHGFFLPDQAVMNDERLIGAWNETRSIPLDKSGKPIENPLLRCGLLFAGCNQREGATGDDDGILTGMEIVSIDFRGTDLVVLSACETGVGDVRNGEGVAGLRQAFQLAGAKAVVASLWQVPDRDSAIIMNDFFVNVAAGQTASEAMRQAQLKRIEARKDRFGAAHPLYWAAWTVTE